MTPHQYQELCFRTLSGIQKFWEPGVDSLQGRRALLANAALGMAGEAAEIDHTPTSDECGDAYWYAYVFMRGIDMEPLLPQPLDEEISPAELMRTACVVCEWVKKHLYHGKPLDQCSPILQEKVKRYIDIVATLDQATPSETFAQNIAKLRGRYPDGFRTYTNT